MVGSSGAGPEFISASGLVIVIAQPGACKISPVLPEVVVVAGGGITVVESVVVAGDVVVGEVVVGEPLNGPLPLSPKIATMTEATAANAPIAAQTACPASFLSHLDMATVYVTLRWHDRGETWRTNDSTCAEPFCA